MFTSSVYALNEDNDDTVYVIDEKSLTITGPLEMEIIWILSIATITKPLIGTSRLQKVEINTRIQIIQYHGKILYNYLKPDYFKDDTFLENFVNLYVESIQSAINQTTKNLTYLDLWRKYGLPLNLGDVSRELPIHVVKNIRQTKPLSENTSLPGGIRLGGTIKKRKQYKKRRTIKRKNNMNKKRITRKDKKIKNKYKRIKTNKKQIKNK